jgi:hypothetical protein
MEAASLPSYVLKLEWAGQYIGQLQTIRQAWLDSGVYRIVEETDSEGYTIHRAKISGPFPPGFALLAGDVVHNLRSALDHLALALAAANLRPDPVPAEVERDSEFPVLPYMTDRGKLGSDIFGDISGRKLKDAHPEAVRIIEGIQPYHRGPDSASPPLWLIHELDRIDKHRRLNLVAHGFAQAALLKGDVDVRQMGYSGPVEDGVVLAAFKTTNPDSYAQTSRDVGFAEGSPAEYEFVVPTLAKLREFVGSEVFPLFERFL